MNTKENQSNKIGITETINISRTVQSFCLKSLTVGVDYLAGLFDLISPCYIILILVLFLYRDHRRSINKFNQHLAMAVSLRSDERMIVVSPDLSLSWSHFPEIEVCEWLNKISNHLWPYITRNVAGVLKNKIELEMNRALSAYKSNPNFRFNSLSFGSVAPRICGLKVYKKNFRNFENIVIDLSLYYCGDINIYFYLMSLGGGIQNLEISGWIRIVIRLRVKPGPLVGGIEVFFSQKPKIDYDFTGAMDVLKVPGIRGILRRVIDDQLSLQMVLPNRIIIKKSGVVVSGDWKCPDPEGLIRVQVIEAKDLSNNGSKFFDPYVTIIFGSQTAYSEFFENSVNPEWNFLANFMIDYSYYNEYLLIKVNERNENVSLGQVMIELSLAKEKKFIRSWVQLEDTLTGMINLEIHYYDLAYETHVVSSAKLPFVLVVFINTATNLVNPRIKNTPNSTVYLEIGSDIKVSKPVLSENPVFEEVFLFVIDNDPKNSWLKLKLIDFDTKTALGNASIPLKRVFEARFMEAIDQVCPLLGAATESSISLSLRLRLLKH